MEVVVTSVIFIIATAGILSTVSMLRPHGQISSDKIEAAYIGKGIMGDLRTQVLATTTAGEELFGPDLALGAHGPWTINGYTVTYTVTEPIPNVRKLEMDISW
ncbi:MAG: hypothetical protein JW847_03490 [Candidatus Omnitrophica bacterium]|nr:hypothetical protein [Candidatus Omnitrophota bacterium]